MGWARLDDGFHDHPKIDGLSLAAVGLYTLCLTWAHRHRRTAIAPGHVTVARVRKVAGRQVTQLSSELVSANLWEACTDSVHGGWMIHDFAEYLPKERDADERQQSGRKGAAKRWQTDSKLPSSSHEDDGKPVANPMASDSSRASARAFPTRPVPEEHSAPTVLPAPLALAVAVADEIETINQRANRLAKTYTDLVPMSRFPAVAGIVKAAIRGAKSDAEISQALTRLGNEGRSLTVETLRIEIEGQPAPTRRTPTTDERVMAGMDLAARLRAEEANYSPKELQA